MKVCENCNCEHDGSFASGRFCTKKCAKSFSTKNNRNEINKKISKSLSKNKFEPIKRKCKECSKEFIIHEFRRRNKLFCCRSCASKFNISKAIVKNTGNKERGKKISEKRKQLFKSGDLSITGGTTKWYDYKDIRVQGTYELRTCKILDKWKEQGKIKDWEYTNDRITYVGLDKKEHTYLLDFKIFDNDSYYYLETKGWKDETDELKWKAVKNRGDKLVVWFDEDIIEYEKLFS
jgi:hypothetical protein